MLGLLSIAASGLSIRQPAPALSRRMCIKGALSAAALPLLGAPVVAEAAEEDIEVRRLQSCQHPPPVAPPAPAATSTTSCPITVSSSCTRSLHTSTSTTSSSTTSAAQVYFGCGCFWHVQHEFVEAERKLLGRDDMELTSYAGYAGGNAGASNGKVCYHNAMQVADYGKLGHAEAVGMKIPPSKFGAMAEEYCKLFNSEGARPDQLGDRGLEYRNVVGIPGGVNSPLAKELVRASVAQGDKLDFAAGKGDDADRRGLVWIYDTAQVSRSPDSARTLLPGPQASPMFAPATLAVAQYPFYLGEVYHQFHDGFAWGEDYPNSYNNIVQKKVKAKQLRDAGCPNGMLGVGIAGL